MVKLFVMRHAESLEDVDSMAYERIADEDMPLTPAGKIQATLLRKFFINEIPVGHSLQMYLSPSKRVLETANLVASSLGSIPCRLITEKRIAKQNWGDVTVHNRKEIERERYQTGVLRYQFPNGENGTDLLRRFNSFAEALKENIISCEAQTHLIITHGFELRVLLMLILGWTEEYFESLAHPLHCEIKRIEYDKNTFRLLDQMNVYDPSRNPNFIWRIK